MFEKILTSRTVWTVVLMFTIGGLQAISGFMPESIYLLINTVLLALAAYFKINPSQPYGKN
jgi:antibiotic biosynthesis monooxygenase (ABM) superfamily enzyme